MLAIIWLTSGNFINVWQPVSDNLPARKLFVEVSAIAMLVSSAGLLVRVGFGGPFGFVHVTSRAGPKDSRFALATTEHTEEDVTFSYLGQAWHVSPSYLLPSAAVADIVAFIYRTRELPNWVSWQGHAVP